MILRWLLAWAHLIALGIGLGAVRALNCSERAASATVRASQPDLLARYVTSWRSSVSWSSPKLPL